MTTSVQEWSFLNHWSKNASTSGQNKAISECASTPKWDNYLATTGGKYWTLVCVEIVLPQSKQFYTLRKTKKTCLYFWVNPFSESSPSPRHVGVWVRVFLRAEITYTFLWFNSQKANTKCFHRRRLYLNVSFWRGSLFLLIPPITTESPVQLLRLTTKLLGNIAIKINGNTSTSNVVLF